MQNFDRFVHCTECQLRLIGQKGTYCAVNGFKLPSAFGCKPINLINRSKLPLWQLELLFLLGMAKHAS